MNNNDLGRVPLAPGSREPSPAVSAASGFDPSRIGFTGTQHGVTNAQRYALLLVLARRRLSGSLWMHNGDCLGADNVAAKLWRELDGKVHLHPPSIDTKRAFMDGELVEDPRPYRDRNPRSVPRTRSQLRSGEEGSKLHYGAGNRIEPT